MNWYRVRAMGSSNSLIKSGILTAIVITSGGCTYHGGHPGQPGILNAARSSIVSTAAYGNEDDIFLPPVVRLVHRRVAPGPTPVWGQYFAMYAPWPPGSSVRFVTGIETIIEQHTRDEDQPPAPDAGFGLPLSPLGARGSGIAAAPLLREDINVSYFVAIDGTGWAYLTGKHPKIRTKRVIGGSDGTTFVVHIAESETQEYHRFALLDPATDPVAGKTVVLTTNVTISDPTKKEITLTAGLPCAVFVYDKVTPANSYWLGPVAVVGPNTDRRWHGFRDVIEQSSNDARDQGLPFDLAPPV